MSTPMLFLILALAAAAPHLAPDTDPPKASASMTGTTTMQTQASVPESVTRGFAQVAGWVQQAADAVPADRYGYRPTDGTRTFGQLVAHLIDSYNYYCRLAKGPTEWSDPVEKGVTDKAQLSRLLATAAQECRQAHTGGKTDPLVENLAHTNLHYGNLTTYLRLMGIVPPSSR